MSGTTSLMPTWVRPDPAAERVVDAVGVSRYLDQCADDLLPGLSSLTRRARYLAFFAWARQLVHNGDPQAIHRWEVALAAGEHHLHRDDPTISCRYLGMQRIGAALVRGGGPPRNPRLVTLNDGWHNYRPVLVAMQLLDPKRPYALTADGERIAQLYRRGAGVRGPWPGVWRQRACLSAIPPAERQALRELLGWSPRGRWSCQDGVKWKRRQATIRALRGHQHPDARASLRWWSTRRGRDETERNLCRAGSWSALSLGMTGLLAAWSLCSDRRRTSLINAIAAAGRRRHPEATSELKRGALDEAISSPAALDGCIGSLRLAVDGPASIDGNEVDPIVTWAGLLAHGRDTRDSLEQLVDRHERIKVDLAWTIKKNRESIPNLVQMPSIRIDALYSMGQDLGDGFEP